MFLSSLLPGCSLLCSGMICNTLCSTCRKNRKLLFEPWPVSNLKSESESASPHSQWQQLHLAPLQKFINIYALSRGRTSTNRKRRTRTWNEGLFQISSCFSFLTHNSLILSISIPQIFITSYYSGLQWVVMKPLLPNTHPPPTWRCSLFLVILNL